MFRMRWWGVLPIAVAASAVLAGCQDDNAPPATLVAIATLPLGSAGPEPLRVFDAVAGETRLETQPGKWRAPAFSPDGKRLFAIRIPGDDEGGLGDEVELHFVEVASGDDAVVRATVPEAATGVSVATMQWAPDSSRFAYSGKDELIVTDSRGHRLGEPIPQQPSPDYEPSSSRGTKWSKDSKLVAAALNDEILLATREGQPVRTLRAEDLPGGQLGDSVQPLEWLDDGRLAVLLRSGEGSIPAIFAVTVAGGTISATGYDQEMKAKAIIEAVWSAYGPDVAEAEKLVPGGHGFPAGWTADGTGRLVEVTPRLDASSSWPRPKTLVVFTSKASFVVDRAVPLPPIGRSYSVVIIK